MFSEKKNIWKVLYFLPVMPVYLIIYTVIYTFSHYYAFEEFKFSLNKIFVMLLFYFFASMTFICHTFSMLTDPGRVDRNIMKKFGLDEIREDDQEKEKNPLFCKKCIMSRPERTHHCSTCKRCVLKMDHHCPWIANCVGYFNQKAFYLFLFYATVGNLIACICLGMRAMDPSFYNMILRPKRRINLNAEYLFMEVIQSMSDPILIVLGACLSFAMTIAIGALFCYQTYLLLNNLTSIESGKFKRKEDSPYYSKHKILILGSVLNIQSKLMWFIPIFTPNVYNNGYNYFIPGKENENYKILKNEGEEVK